MKFPNNYEHGVDYATWIDEATGFKCEAKRIKDALHWCGYVHVATDRQLVQEDSGIEVHGDVTWAEYEGGVFVCGFDCAHAGDWTLRGRVWDDIGDQEGEYRTLEFVKLECAKLASILKGILHGNAETTTR